MTKEIEQKKEYLTPKMEVIEIEHYAALLNGSPNNPNDDSMDAIFH